MPLLPENARVVLVGDGEYDGIELLTWIREHTSWQFVLRTAKNRLVGTQQRATQEWLSIEDTLAMQSDSWVSFEDVFVTNQMFGPIHVLGWWEEEYDEPWYLLTNISNPDLAGYYYKKRALIENFFSDQKPEDFISTKATYWSQNEFRGCYSVVVWPICGWFDLVLK